MIIFEFINSNFISICTFIGTVCAIYGAYKDKTPTVCRYSKKIAITHKKVSLDKSINKQIKPTFNFNLFNITINKWLLIR
jgi:hypothetical protein